MRFLIGVDIIALWVMTYEKLKSGEIIRLSQDSSWEWVLLFIVICVVMTIISSILIY